jgi:hypothetical protein
MSGISSAASSPEKGSKRSSRGLANKVSRLDLNQFEPEENKLSPTEIAEFKVRLLCMCMCVCVCLPVSVLSSCSRVVMYPSS